MGHQYSDATIVHALRQSNGHLSIGPLDGLLEIIHFVSNLVLTEECDGVQRFPEHTGAPGNP